MRLVVPTSTLALATAFAAPAHAQLGSVRNAFEASGKVVEAVGAIGESGVKASVGVVAIPLGGVAVASGVVAHVAGASGFTDVETAFSAGAAGATGAAKSVVDFSGSPLAVSDDVIVDHLPPQKKGATAAQPPPKVPYAAEQQ